MHTPRAATWDGWHACTRAPATSTDAPRLYMPYDSTDSLDYLVCLEVLPWESFGRVPARVVAEHVEWALRTPLNAMPPVCEARFLSLE